MKTAEEILDQYDDSMDWIRSSYRNVIKAMEEYANQQKEELLTPSQADERAMAFAEWCYDKGWFKYKGIDRWKYNGLKELYSGSKITYTPVVEPKTTAELLSLYDKDRNK